MNIIEQLEKEHIEELGKSVPEFAPGDTLKVNVKVKEGERERLQAFEGVCIARAGRGLNESFTVRKISFGEGVERVFPVYSPLVDSIEVVRRGKVRRAKLYYLRERRGKSARISEKVDRLRSSRDSVVPAIETENEAALMDSAILCKFLRGVFTDLETEAAEMRAKWPDDRMFHDKNDPERGKRYKELRERIGELRKAVNVE